MLSEFVEIFMKNKKDLRRSFIEKHPESYKEVVYAVVKLLNEKFDRYEKPSIELIHEIDDGDYQGTLVYLIGAEGYQPDKYWVTKVSYGSCSGCDTLEAIRDYSDDQPTDSQIDDYMTLCLHLIQQMKEV